MKHYASLLVFVVTLFGVFRAAEIQSHWGGCTVIDPIAHFFHAKHPKKTELRGSSRLEGITGIPLAVVFQPKDSASPKRHSQPPDDQSGEPDVLFYSSGDEPHPNVGELQRRANQSFFMQAGLTFLVVGSSLFVILSKRFAPADRHWAYATVGTLLGFWLRAIK